MKFLLKKGFLVTKMRVQEINKSDPSNKRHPALSELVKQITCGTSENTNGLKQYYKVGTCSSFLTFISISDIIITNLIGR